MRERVVCGLPSLASPVTGEVAGPQHIGFLGRGDTVISIGLGGNPTARGTFGPGGSAMGHPVRLTPDGKWRTVADIAGVEGALNPAGGALDSNPYGLLIEPSRTVVTDARGNSLVSVDANGTTAVVATFAPTRAPPPFNQSEPVPTEVVRGPDGALYVSMLTGAPIVTRAAAIDLVRPCGAEA